MIFLLFVYISNAFESHIAKNICMVFCLGVLAYAIIILQKHIRNTNHKVIAVLLVVTSLWLLIESFASLLKIEWKQHEITPELIGSFSDSSETDVLEPLFVRNIDAFTLTDVPPHGTCASGDQNRFAFEAAVQEKAFSDVSFDFGKYSYVFVRGSDSVQISYSFWGDNSCWYLGLNGFYRSAFDAKLTRLHNCDDSTVYLFRFQKEYVGFSFDTGGSLVFGPIRFYWL